jgi:diadenosine tetraphosphate (Ap4A) HIT family hydrolase
MINSAGCEGADFCEEISGASDTSFNRVYDGDPPSRRILGTENFELLADMSPLTLGHLLLLPKKHYLSFAQVVRNQADEVADVVGRVSELYAGTFCAPLVLEHGSTADANHQACITHAHLHLLPVNGGLLDDILMADGLNYRDLDSFRHLGEAPWPDSSYFLRYYEDQCRVYLSTSLDKRQYLRSVVGKILSIDDPEWDYAVVVRKSYLRSTMDMVKSWKFS